MAKRYIKAGIPAGALYETINSLTGLSEDKGSVIPQDTTVGHNNEITIKADGNTISIGKNKEISLQNGNLTLKSTNEGSEGVVEGTIRNSMKLGNKDPQYYGAKVDTIDVYTHRYEAPWHYFTGHGKNGRALLTTKLSEGDKFWVINDQWPDGHQVTAWTGGEHTDELYSGHWMSFTVDGENLFFIGGGGTSKLMLKAGGEFTGQVNFGKNTGAYIDASGNGHLNEFSADNISVSGTLTGGKVKGALYNDYAEYLPRGEKSEPGDIIALNLEGNNENYIKATKDSKVIAGIHSNEWGHILGGDGKEDEEERFIPVSMAGRVKVKVIGSVKKGQWIVPSDVPGVGCAIDTQTPNSVGYAVEQDDLIEERLLRVRVM